MGASNSDDALKTGRRIYLGNLPYTVKPYDVEEMLAANGFEQVDNIHISVDPVSARNPGYCFVDFADRDTAERALSELVTEIGGRSVKVGPCEPKKYSGSRDESFAFQRWGDWRVKGEGEREEGRGRRHGGYHHTKQGPYGALDHFDDMVNDFSGRRLFVGGLGKMSDQAQNSREVREIFQGFNPTAIGKRITPREEKRHEPGNHHYCFVDFETRDEAAAAIKALDGKPVPGGRLKVAPARGMPDKLVKRHSDYQAQAGAGGFRRSRQGGGGAPATTGPSKAMASTDWRRVPDGG
ncbi:hypothetical protein L249_3722 [Ophiocordyceps polyrhachis-furcata BCC 54312]|uniref:RRM domain-containing protein n=1 Tax=Ophiocordyceps polyrhachis-furcata BCC 54312 TaxID=1330021 RepID=A0A367L4P4_9HYPO|nr:hypothetical protein L249_3722 [Ophiocordyceps polyrhachis-furcata BCC 54312]